MLRWKAIGFAAIFMAVISTGYLFAQTQPGSRPPRNQEGDQMMERQVDGMFRAMDANHDGKISKSEWNAYQDKQFRRIDSNGKGYITKNDVMGDLERMKSEYERGQRSGGPPPQQ